VWLAAFAVISAAGVLACGGGGSNTPTTPTTPTPPPTTPVPPTPPPATAFSLAGRVVSSATGQPIAGARIAPEVGEAVTSGPDGAFSFASTSNPPTNPYKVDVTADGYVTRNALVRSNERTRTGVEIDLFPSGAPFSLDFFRQLVRNTHDAPDTMEPLRRLTVAPALYIRTVDDAGRTIDPATVNLVESVVRRSVQAWSAGALNVTRVETGAEERVRTAGWITIVFIDQPEADFCARAAVAASNGFMEFNYNNCGCGGRRIAPSIITHETGHALGFWHVRDRGAIMSPVYDNPCTDEAPTPNELLHARLAYRRSPGHRDPDQDPQSGAFALPSLGLDAPEVICTLRH
jgi:hypothetical protein